MILHLFMYGFIITAVVVANILVDAFFQFPKLLAVSSGLLVLFHLCLFLLPDPEWRVMLFTSQGNIHPFGIFFLLTGLFSLYMLATKIREWRSFHHK